jgi:hypothetical protein
MLQLDQEKAEVHEDLAKKIAKIVELHKEVEEKSKMVVEKEEQCNALLIQLIESKFLIDKKYGLCGIFLGLGFHDCLQQYLQIEHVEKCFGKTRPSIVLGV